MSYGIDMAKARNIIFSMLDEDAATRIMETEYAPQTLLSYTPLFPCYITGERKGQAISVDFAYLYDLASLDTDLRKLVLIASLELEQSLCAIFLADCRRVDVGDELVKAFVSSDADYLYATYTPDNVDILAKSDFTKVPLEELPLSTFLEVLQFGTFQRLLRFFYHIHAPSLYGKTTAPFENDLDALRHMRNAAAHNTSLINQLNETKSFEKNLQLLSLLGRNGVRHKTLTTNMAKPVMCDLLCLLRLYSTLMPPLRTEQLKKLVLSFLTERCTTHASYYKKSPTLLSAYHFLLQSVPVLLSENT